MSTCWTGKDWLSRVIEERDRLRAEVAEWRQAAKVEAKLRREFREEADRLRADLANCGRHLADAGKSIMVLADERDRLRADLAQMRALLHRVFTMTSSGQSSMWVTSDLAKDIREFKERARTAREGEGG